MKRSLHLLLTSILVTGTFLSGASASAQCTTWANPAPPGGWTDFNSTFGGAPCDPGDGCPFNEIDAFEIYADEAYLMDNINEGGTYTFSACNGTGGTAWDISFTIIAPSGEVDAFGLNDGSICELTWTATETGTYTIVISEAGVECGASTNDAVDNGYPAITCNGSPETACAPAPENNTCEGATALQINNTCIAIDATTANATESMEAIECNEYISPVANDVWFSFVAEATEHTISVLGVDDFDAVVELLSGACGSTTSLTCADDTFVDGEDPVNEMITYSSFVVGETYYVRVYDYAHGGTDHNFQICVMNGIVGVNDMDRNAFTVFPNPTEGDLTIQSGDLNGNVLVEITDMTGRLVYTANKQLVAGQNTVLELDGKLTTGSYHLALTTSEGRSVKSVVVR